MEVQQIDFLIKILVAVITLTGVIGGLMWHQHRAITSVDDKNEARIKRVYERIDEEKQKTRDEFVIKEVCSIQHQQLIKDISEIKTDVKTILRKNGFKDPE